MCLVVKANKRSNKDKANDPIKDVLIFYIKKFRRSFWLQVNRVKLYTNIYFFILSECLRLRKFKNERCLLKHSF